MSRTKQEILDALRCIGTCQRPCAGCAFNPEPGKMWAYGCRKGEADLADAIREALGDPGEEWKYGKKTEYEAQPPRLLSFEEACEDAPYVFLEARDRPGDAMMRRMDAYPEKHSMVIMRFGRMPDYYPMGCFGPCVRAWSAKPSKRLMEETEWPDE